MKFKNVSNGKLITIENGELSHKAIVPRAFVGTPMAVDDFDITSYKKLCHVETAMKYLSDTKQLKEDLKANTCIKLTISNSETMFIVLNKQVGNLSNVLTFNKACAVLAYNVLIFKISEIYDWSIKKYVENPDYKKYTPDNVAINRLAGQIGLTFDDECYWFCVPGYEFLFDIFPAEAIAYTMIRLKYRKRLNIPDAQSDSDIVNSLTSKINRRCNLETCKAADAIKMIGIDNIKTCYDNLTHNIDHTGRSRRNDDMVGALNEILRGITN